MGKVGVDRGRGGVRDGAAAETQRVGRDAEPVLIAVRALHGQSAQADAFRLLALHYKRQGDWDRAVRLWERWISTAAEDTVHPYIELAKYHEWQSKDLDQADTYTRWAMYVRESSPLRHPPQTAAELQHRLTRISRKQRRLAQS